MHFYDPFKKSFFWTICSVYILHNTGLNISDATFRDFGVILLNVPFFELYKFLFHFQEQIQNASN